MSFSMRSAVDVTLALAAVLTLGGVLSVASPVAHAVAPQDAEKTEKKADDAKKAEAAKKDSEAKRDDAAKKPADSSEGKPDDTAADEAAEQPAEEEKEPDPPVFRLRDGTRITGFPQVERITIDTAYGQLVVPLEDVVRIRFAREEDPELQDRIAVEIRKLGDEEFEIREEAMAALAEIGEPALKALKAALESDDEEVKSRAQTLIGRIEETIEDDFADEEGEEAVPIRGEDDELVTLKFTAKGKIHERTFNVKSNYGVLAIQRKDVISIVYPENMPSQVELSVPGTYFAAANNWYQTKIALKKGDQISIAASGQIYLQNYSASAGPDGTTRTSTKHFESFRLGALVARIGKNGKAFLVGKSYKGKANAAGKLMFATAVRSGSVTGAFNVKVQLPDE